MLRRIIGVLLLGTGVIACPCHLPLTLPIMVGLLGGTALGSLLTSNPLILGIGMLIYFVLAIAAGIKLLGSGSRERNVNADCCGIDHLRSEGQSRKEAENVVRR